MENENENTLYLPRDLVTAVDRAIHIENISSHQVILWNNRRDRVLPASVHGDVSLQDRTNCHHEVSNFMTKVRKVFHTHTVSRMLEYATNEKKMMNFDGQPISSFDELKKLFDRHRGDHDKDSDAFDCLYKPFSCGWTAQVETQVMADLNIKYRKWTNKERAPIGFVARCLTKVLKEKRGRIKWLRRRLPCEKDDEGHLKRRRGMHRMEFDPSLHYREDVEGPIQTKKKVSCFCVCRCPCQFTNRFIAPPLCFFVASVEILGSLRSI